MRLRSNSFFGSALSLAWQSLLLIALSVCAFRYNLHYLYVTNDGATFLSLAHEQGTFFGKTLSLHSNMLQGLSNLSLGVNLAAMPAFWTEFYDPVSGAYSPVFSYAFFSLLFFLSVRLIGWNYAFPRHVCNLAAWGLTLFYYPYLVRHSIYPITQLIPNIAVSFMVVALSDALIWRAGEGRWLSDVLCAAGLLFVLMLLLVVSPVSITFLLPYLAGSFICACIWMRKGHRWLRKALVCATVGVVSLMLGWVTYEVGLHLYSAVNFLTANVHVGPLDRMDVSILFQGRPFQNTHTDRTMGMWLFLAASLGALLFCAKEHGFTRARIAAAHVITVQVTLIAGGLLLPGMFADWVYPIPVYFEGLYFPLYALFAVYPLTLLVQKLSSLRPIAIRRNETRIIGLQALSVALVAVYIVSVPRLEERQEGFDIPPGSTEISRILEKEISIYPPEVFRGRVVSLIEGKQFEEQFSAFYTSGRTLKNEHMTTSLWLKYIPTLVEYNQLITPYYFWFIQEFLQEPGIGHRRNWTNFSRANVPALRLLGARFIITTDDLTQDVTKRAELKTGDSTPVRLFEISGANVAGFSAERIVRAKDLEAVKRSLLVSDFNPGLAAVMTDVENFASLDGKTWSPAKRSELRAEAGGWHISAESSGWTMLLVPIEYSHCLLIQTRNGDAPAAFRVNAVLTGLVFFQRMDVVMETSTGIFNRPECRWNDFWDFKNIQ